MELIAKALEFFFGVAIGLGIGAIVTVAVELVRIRRLLALLVEGVPAPPQQAESEAGIVSRVFGGQRTPTKLYVPPGLMQDRLDEYTDEALPELGGERTPTTFRDEYRDE